MLGMSLKPCDWCHKEGHVWFQCPDPKRPANWKPERLKALGVAKATDTPDGSGREAGPTPKSTAALVSEPRSGQSTAGKSASRTVPQASHADNRVEVTDRMSDQTGPSGGRHQQPALRTDVALGAVDLPKIEAETAHLAPKKRGRPATGFDKKAYDKQKAKELRDRKKAKP